MQPSHRDRFDALLEDAIAALPPRLHELIAEIPVVVDDRPPRELVRSLRREWGDDDESVSDDEVAAELCGLHSGVPLTEQTVEAPALTSDIRLFREGIVAVAGGWGGPDAEDRIYDEIVVTLLHEIGHHFGLDEDDLAGLGYE